jgi:vancomycin aglycone glucosyltransferase
MTGAPQTVIPLMFDQFYWAERVERLGIGCAHAAGAPTTESLTLEFQRSLRAEVAERAAAVAPLLQRKGAAAARCVLN